MRIRIPKSFKVHGHTFKVTMEPNLPSMYGAVGRCHSREHIVQLAPASAQIPKSEVEQTYIHELIHICFDKAGYNELACDEQLVDGIAAILHQIFTTSEY